MKKRQEAVNKMSGKKRVISIIAVLSACVCGCAGAYIAIGRQNAGTQASETDGNYKTSEVQKGTVSVEISEDGTVTYGTVEQDFSVSEVSDSSSESSSSASGTDSSSQSDTAAQTADTSGEAASAGGTSDGGTTMTGAAMSSGSTDSSSSSDTTSLEVESVAVSVGEVVSEGDTLLTISQDSIDEYRSELEAAVESAELTVEQEKINEESAQAEADYTYNMYIAEGESAQETYDATVASLQKTVDDLEEQLEEAQDDVDTYQEYVDEGYDYDDELEEAQDTYDDLEDQLTVAQNNLTTGTIEAKQTLEQALTNYKYADELYEIDTDGIGDDLEDAEEALEEAQAALDDFDEQIGDGTIRSEYSGTVTSLSYETGDNIVNDAAVAEFSSSDDVTIDVSVTQDDISGISVGDAAVISLDAYENETFDGEVTAIDTTASMGSSTVAYTVTVKFTGDVSKVYNGMTGEVSFPVESEEDTLYVPNSAVYLDGTQSYVKVLNDDGTITRVDIETGFSNNHYVAVTSGLTEGQIVVIEGTQT